MNATSRQKEIEVLINECKEDAERTNQPLERRGMEIMGRKEVLEVYRLPIEPLKYNIRNGRFAAELREMESKMGRTLDSNDPEDEKIIKKILLEQNKNETEVLKSDIKIKGQIDPGLITYDGYVTNGNRRMAILDLLHKETGESRFEYLDVQVLPRSITPTDLWRIEAGLQLSQDKRLAYSPINQLLKLDEGIHAGLTPNEIVKSYYGNVTAKDIELDLERLELIREYLVYIEKPEQYKMAENWVEHFINLQKNIKKLRNKGLTETEINEAIILGYEVILGEARHLDVRHLADVYLSERAKKESMEILLNENAESCYESKEEELAEDNKDEDEDEDEETRKDEPLSSDDGFLRRKAKAKQIRDAYKNGLDIVEYEKDRERPKKLIKKAFDALDSIDQTSGHIYTEDIKTCMVALAKKVQEILKLIKTKG